MDVKINIINFKWSPQALQSKQIYNNKNTYKGNNDDKEIIKRTIKN